MAKYEKFGDNMHRGCYVDYDDNFAHDRPFIVNMSGYRWRVAIWVPFTGMRVKRVYRLKSARGLFTIHKAPGLDYSAWGLWDIVKHGTAIPRSTANPLRTFYILYNYARKPYKTGGNQ